MTKLKQIQDRLCEAEVYLKQGLLVEAREVYIKIAKVMTKKGVDPAILELLKGVDEKIGNIQKEIDSFASSEVMPELSEDMQKKIADSYSSSQLSDGEENRFKGAVALAEFGQYERAVAEFETFLGSQRFRVRAAEYILKCFIEESDVDRAVECYRNWEGRDLFGCSELESIRLFLLKRYFFTKGMKGLEFNED